MKSLPLVVGAALATVLMAVSPAYAATTNVSITSTGFLPESITIKAGDTVVWTNNDTTDHTATDDELSWDTDVIAPDATDSHTFTTAGSYTYSDTIDPTLTGTITVTAATTTTTTTSPTPTATTTATTTTKGGTPTTPVSGAVENTIALLVLGGLLLGGGVLSRRFV